MDEYLKIKQKKIISLSMAKFFDKKNDIFFNSLLSR